MPKVTVLLPVCNGANFLGAAMESVLDQTFKDFELLIVDDGSTDDSLSIAGSFKDPRVRILVNETRLKLAGALNRGIASAEGELIARMDCDDVCAPARLQRQVDYLDAHPFIAMCGSWVKAFGDHESAGAVFKYPLKPAEVKAGILFDNSFAHPSVMFRKQVFLDKGLAYDGSYYPAEDYELWTRILDKVDACNIGEVLLLYRLHGESMTLSGKPDMDAQAVRVLQPVFARLGIKASDEDLMFHRYISTQRLFPDWNEACIDRVENWLAGIDSVNNETGLYDTRAIRNSIGSVWFNVMYRSIAIGVGNYRRYAGFSKVNGVPSLRDKAVMFMAALKRILKSTHHQEA